MRKVLWVAAASGSLFILHCSSNTAPHLDAQPNTGGSTGSKTGSKTSKTPPPDTSTTAIATHPVKTAPDSTTKATTPGADCKALSTCCSKISNSTQQTSCLQTAGKANEQVCTAAQTKFACDSLTTAPTTRGPSCTGLTDGALYCGNDGPGGDPTTLYLCTGTTIAISRICPNGCTTNNGVDDSCSTSGTPGPAVSASCKGLSGDYCGTDFVQGNANTLYSCANDTISDTTICQNGCVTNADATLNDTCETTAATTTTVSCAGLPDEAFCGTDLGGDTNTLYTCNGGAVSKTQVCSSGCTIAAPSVSDFCTSTSAADCEFLNDGDYCGTNGPMGDPSTLYTCEAGMVQSNPTVCTFGCISNGAGGTDLCNGGG